MPSIDAPARSLPALLGFSARDCRLAVIAYARQHKKTCREVRASRQSWQYALLFWAARNRFPRRVRIELETDALRQLQLEFTPYM